MPATDENEPRYEYRLTFTQAFCNPVGPFLLRCATLGVLLFQIYVTAFPGAENRTAYFAGWVIAFFMVLIALPGLFFGSQPWNARRWIEFRDRGIAGDYEPYSSTYKLRDQSIELKTIPYRALAVRRDLLGILTLHSVAHGAAYALIPEKIISKEALERRIREGAERAKTLPEDVNLRREIIKAQVVAVLKRVAAKREISVDAKIMNELITNGDDATEAILSAQDMTGIRPPKEEWAKVSTVDQMIDLLVKYAV